MTTGTRWACGYRCGSGRRQPRPHTAHIARGEEPLPTGQLTDRLHCHMATVSTPLAIENPRISLGGIINIAEAHRVNGSSIDPQTQVHST